MEMNHYCLNVLQRITVPDFLDSMRSVFPFLYAIDKDNSAVMDLHDPEKAYFVMHEHVVQQRFPNLVAGFLPEIKLKLDTLLLRASAEAPLSLRLQKAVEQAIAKPVAGQQFNTPKVENCAGELISTISPGDMLPEQECRVEVIITNKSVNPWHGYGSHPVLLSYHWLDMDGAPFQHDGLRTPLVCETVQPGQSVNEIVNVVAPAAKGNYQLVLTLVQEGVCWFEGEGFNPAIHEVVVE